MAVTNGVKDEDLLRSPDGQQQVELERKAAEYVSLPVFQLPRGEQRHYQQQFADMYFARLTELKPAVEAAAAEPFNSFAIANRKARRVDRVLDVRQGELCWVVGTIFMDMPLKPNVLEDLGREHWIAAPPPVERYRTEDGAISVMLEDESGRLNLTGEMLNNLVLVTGAIVAVIGTENRDGEFEVLDVKVPDLPRQPQRWEEDDAEAAVNGQAVPERHSKGGKIAIISGLDFTADAGDTLTVDLLMEYLLGEATSSGQQDQISEITRLIIAGDSLSNANPIQSRKDATEAAKNKQRKYGYDSTTYNAAPTEMLDAWLASILPSLPVTILPGATDPTATSLPQPALHMAHFPLSRAYAQAPDSEETGWLDSTTNPAYFSASGYKILATGGQTVDDVFKYLDSESRVEMMEAMMRWRLIAPTAPDTLWCYPFQDRDRFVMHNCPHVFIAGNQPRFETVTIEGSVGQKVRLIAVPKFKKSGELILLDEETLECEVVSFGMLDP